MDTTAPYNCASESYAGSETQFGATDTNGFSGDNGSSTFSGSVNITTTRAMCVYVVLDVTSAAANAETIDIEITQGGDDIGLSSGTIAPLIGVPITGSTTLAGAIITQSDFHWRLDNGSEVTASSATNGIENTVLTEHSLSAPIRLRIGVYNNGSATSSAQQLQLEFGPKVTTCSAVSVWTAVESASDDWDMATSSNLTEGANTTNIAVGNGGVTDRDTTFITVNAGVHETSDTTGGIVFSPSNYTDLEYSIKSTNITLHDTAYCFRVTNLGTPLPAYTQLGEIRTAPLRDFKIQRGDTTVSGTSTTLLAGVNYTAPASTTTAFVRITNTHYTGSGRNTAGGGAQNNDDVSAYISASNLGTSFTISRPTTAISNTKVTWEIIEFIGEDGTDNQMSVRNVGTVSMGLTQTVATGTTGILVGDDADVVVFVTGIRSANTGRNVFYAQQVTSAWNATSSAPVFTRDSSGAVIDVSYAVVDFSGINWQVQRVEHTYASSTITETESIAPVNGLTRTFIHAQKRMGALGNVNNFGHEVWLSSIGSLSFKLEPLATTPSGHVSVAWVIENFQTSGGAMYVQRSNGTTDAGTEPFTQSVPLFVPIEATNNTTIHSMSRVVGANSNFPLPQAGAYINSTSTYTLWRSEATGQLTYRTEIVEWPINGLAVRQNYYRFYEDNDALLPTDPWPPGGTDLGENTSITAVDEPLGDGDRVRLRMSLKVSNANLPAGLYDFKLQYGQRVTSCATVADWSDVGNSGSGSIWRAYDAAGVVNGTALSAANPPTVGDVLLSVSDVAGSYVENSPSPQNPYSVLENNDIEYDWNLEHNGALERTVYCFRMVRADGTPIDGYLNYPQIRTAGFSPITKSWRWYDDATSTTPTAALAAQSVAPIEIQNGNTIALRVTVGERKGVPGLNVKFRLEYDEDPNFSNPKTPSATSTCTATSTWCYAAGGGLDNATITAKVLTDADTCTAGVGSGCGKHNSSATFVTGDTHLGGANREYAFYITHAAARVGAVYYFRLYDIYNDQPVVPTASSTSPSLVAETAKLTLSVGGLSAGTTTSGVVLTATSTSAGVTFGTLPVDQNAYAAQRVSITTNATEGYRVLMYSPQQLLNTYGVAIPAITGTNAVPVGWAVGCQASSTGCVGYHTTDPTLQNGSTRFAAVDSYAALSATPAEVMYSPIPVNESHDILYRVFVRALQPAGNYETDLVYIAVPTY